MPEKDTTVDDLEKKEDNEAGEDNAEEKDKSLEAKEDGAKADGKEEEAGKGEEGKGEDEEVKMASRQRKSPKDYIIERKERQLEKAKADKSKGEDAKEDFVDEDDEDVAPEDEAVIAKVATKILKPILDKNAAEEDDREVKDFLSQNPDFGPYEKRARQYLAHPSRRDVPIDEIFYSVAGKDLMKIGARKANIADDKAKKGGSGGGSSRGDEGGSSIKDLSRDDFQRRQEEVRRRRA